MTNFANSARAESWRSFRKSGSAWRWISLQMFSRSRPNKAQPANERAGRQVPGSAMINLLVHYWQSFIQGIGMTAVVSAAAIVLGMLPGLVLAFGLLSRNPLLRAVS